MRKGIEGRRSLYRLSNLMLNCHSLFSSPLFSFTKLNPAHTRIVLSGCDSTSVLIMVVVVFFVNRMMAGFDHWRGFSADSLMDRSHTEKSVGSGAQLPSLTTANDDYDDDNDGIGGGGFDGILG